MFVFFRSWILAATIGLTWASLTPLSTALAETGESLSTSSLYTTPSSWLGLQPKRFGASYFGWFFMDGESLNQGQPDDSFSIQNFGITYSDRNNYTWGLWYASTLSWNEQGQSEHTTANPYIEVKKFGWGNIFGDVSISGIVQLYFPVTEQWRKNGTSELYGFFWFNKPLSKKWELEFHINPRYSHHQRLREVTPTASGTEVEGLPGLAYLQELKARYVVTPKFKVFQLLGLETKWSHRGKDSDSFGENFEIETGIEWTAHRSLWLQASIRQNISQQPYFRDLSLYQEDQTEYQLRLSANL